MLEGWLCHQTTHLSTSSVGESPVLEPQVPRLLRPAFEIQILGLGPGGNHSKHSYLARLIANKRYLLPTPHTFHSSGCLSHPFSRHQEFHDEAAKGLCCS